MTGDPQNNGEKRLFSDVRTGRVRTAKKLRSWLANRGRVVDLKPTIYKRHPVLVSAVVFLAAIAVFLGFRQLFTRAEVADFYPSTCLGEWAKPQNAEGTPEMLSPSASTTFNEDDSAVFISGVGQIFCGGFVPPDYVPAGDIESVGITFVWQIGESTATSSFPQGAEASTSTPPAAQDQAQDSSTAPQADVTSTTSLLDRLQDLMIHPAFAQTDSSDTSQAASDVTSDVTSDTTSDVTSDTTSDVTDGTTTPVEDATPSTTVIGPPLDAPLAPVAPEEASDTGEQSSSQVSAPVPAPVPPAPDDNFLQVSYSTDGQTWVAIAKVSASNWQNFTVTLPVADWDELKKLQIQIAGIPTTQNPTPKVYLDGMFAEVHYDVPPIIAGAPDGGSGSQPANGPVEVPEGTPIIVLPPSQKPLPANPEQNTFKADEAPQFELDLNSLSASSSAQNP